MTWKEAKSFRITLLIIASVLFLIGLIATNSGHNTSSSTTNMVENKTTNDNHDPKDIIISISQMKTGKDSLYYYLDSYYTIQNNTPVAITYIKIYSNYYDKSETQIGTIGVELGSMYGVSDFKLEPGETIEEVFTAKSPASSSSHPKVFVELFNNGLKNVKVNNEAAEVKWADGRTYKAG